MKRTEKIHKNDTLLFITPLFPPYVGASERRNSDFVYAIKQFTNNIYVLCVITHTLRPQIPNYQEKKIKNVRVFRFEIKNKWVRKLLRFVTFYNPLYIWLCFLSSLIFILIKRPKYVIVNVPPYPFGFSVALACKIIRKKLILDLIDIPGRIGFRGSHIILPMLSIAEIILTVNNPIKKELALFKNPRSFKVIPNSIDSEIIR